MKTIEIKGTVFGQGLAKICIPTTQDNYDDLIKTLKEYKKLACQVIEIRIDYLTELNNLTDLFLRIKELNLPQVLLFTCRSLEQGGNYKFDRNQIYMIYRQAIASKIFNIFDLELSWGRNIIIDLTQEIRENNAYTMISHHDFTYTPTKESMMSKLALMNALGGDILKMALMPSTKQDVLNVLEVSNYINSYYDKPVVMISMGEIGSVSRIIGYEFGNAITFAKVGDGSAPGQLSLEDLNKVFDILNKLD